MADKKPKLEFKTNLPEKFLFVKMFKQGENNYGKYYCCEIKQGDTEKTMFASEALWKKLNKVSEGDTVEATLSEIKSDDGKTHKEWQVTNNGVEQHVSKTKEIADTGEAKEEYLKEKQDKEAEKNSNIRWMNALNNATAIVSILVSRGELIDDPAIKKYILDYANYYYSLPVPDPLFNNEGNPTAPLTFAIGRDSTKLLSERDKEKLLFDKPF